MKLKWDDGSFFLATGKCTYEDVQFTIEMKGGPSCDYQLLSVDLDIAHVKLLKEELDFWLRQVEDTNDMRLLKDENNQ